MDAPIEKRGDGVFFEPGKTAYGKPMLALKDGHIWRVAYPSSKKDRWLVLDPLDVEDLEYVQATAPEMIDLLAATLSGPLMKEDVSEPIDAKSDEAALQRLLFDVGCKPPEETT